MLGLKLLDYGSAWRSVLIRVSLTEFLVSEATGGDALVCVRQWDILL